MNPRLRIGTMIYNIEKPELHLSIQGDQFDYGSLITIDDDLKEFKPMDAIDLKDYVNMEQRKLPTLVKWKSIRSMHVTKNGMTLWRLTEEYFKRTSNAIGNIQPPVSLILWILKAQ